ncbi:MAG TPA: hypothetical protein VN698_13005 [Bacteroidia bacterium]|nr:hypothetical protein [Bacteroidia bacterium]
MKITKVETVQTDDKVTQNVNLEVNSLQEAVNLAQALVNGGNFEIPKAGDGITNNPKREFMNYQKQNIIRYDLIGAHKVNINKHPDIDMKDMGYKILNREAVPIADAIFYEVESYIEPLPSHLDKQDKFTFTELED